MASLEETKEILENMPDSNPIFLEGIHKNHGIGKSSIMKPTTKYNLTIFQKISLPFLYLVWLTYPKNQRMSWHMVKKGMEKHTCDFKIKTKRYGIHFLKCSHEGCNTLKKIEHV